MSLHQYTFIVLEKHLDTFGHVNNATYFELFEEARWQVITERGYGLEEVQKSQKGPVILEIQAQFLKELSLREKIIIESQAQALSSKIFQIDQVMKKENGEIACNAVFKGAFFDLKERKIVEANSAWLKALGVKNENN